MKQTVKLLTTLTITLISQLTFSAMPHIESLNWELKKETDAIKVFAAKVPESPHRAYRAETVIDANPSRLVKIIRNPTSCSEWVYRCENSYRYAQETPNTDLVYTSNQMPFPLKNRDTLARITWTTDPETQIVRARGEATKNILAPNNEHVRIDNATVIWELTPQPNGKTQVKIIVHADPGVKAPAWLVNKLSIQAPIQTLTGLRSMTGN